MKSRDLVPLLLFSFAIALPACEAAGPGEAASVQSLVLPPDLCGNGDPTCNVAIDYPDQSDLTTTNSSNLKFSATDNALVLTEYSGSLFDSDGDAVPDVADDCPGPGWRLPCDGDASNDGIYQTLEYDTSGGVTIEADLAINSTIRNADAYIFMDTSGSMGGELNQLVMDLTTGTFVDPVACPEGAGTGLVGGMKCMVPDLLMGLGEFREVPLSPHADPYDQTPYHHYLDFTDNLQHLTDAVSALVIHGNRDKPEATSQALYSVVTGNGLGPWVPNRGSCPVGRWGYPCFRSNSLPIILMFTDAEMYNGPADVVSYGDPPFNGTLGAGVELPPVEMSPNVLYASDAAAAWDLGDLTSRSLTVMSANTNLGNNATTWNVNACRQCADGDEDCWADGYDAFVKFSLSSTLTPFLSGEGTTYPTHNVAVFDSGLTAVDCDPGPGGGDYWGRLSPTLAAGDYYLVSDAALPLGESSSSVRGPYQLRIQTTPSDPSWLTTDVPILWSDVETELVAKSVKIVSVISDSRADADADALATATNSIDSDGNPYIQSIASDGTGLGTALIDAVNDLINNTRRNISLVPEDNPATTTVDETGFVQAITAVSCPTVGVANCLGGAGTSECTGCLNDTPVQFEFTLGNSIVTQGATTQVFDFEVVGYADGSIELGRFPVRVVVPRTGPDYGQGFYENTYQADDVCEMPPEVPDWGTLAWVGSTPTDSSVEFLIYTANTLAELDSATPVSIAYPTGTTAQGYDVADELQAAGQSNYMPFLRVRAVINGSSDGWQTPVFQGWSMEFNCVPFD